ncbi:protein of unknown function [Candidatus Nitrosocosmicus franklandus]|uniref:Uncharacterized protein n=1 Tax=Candidatus Nitrosocosmicus franklandianus TaxID=1798806 RepID=A0A484IBI1_9ARCH|nr:protein of unknown function [Candidatus Nitrosocosmicus franklandus]
MFRDLLLVILVGFMEFLILKQRSRVTKEDRTYSNNFQIELLFYSK